MGNSRSRVDQLVDAGEHLTASGIPILPIKPRSKKPIPSPETGSWIIVDDPDHVRPVFELFPDANLSILCGRAKGSPVLVVDIDGPTGLAKCQELGVTSGADCWIQRTGGGNFHIVYYADEDLELHRRIKPQGIALDLIVDGYALVEPSITRSPYRWQPGHGPSDVPLADLASPPPSLLEWWREVQNASCPGARQVPEAINSAFSLLGSPIPQGSRNDTLCRIAGWLRLYHPEPVVAALLACVNEARCNPPLPEGEVVGISKSVFRYVQTGVNGHPRALVPTTWEREEENDA